MYNVYQRVERTDTDGSNSIFIQRKMINVSLHKPLAVSLSNHIMHFNEVQFSQYMPQRENISD